MTIIWAALGTGAVYAIVALGFNAVLASGGVFNFAGPQFLLLGALFAYEGISRWSVPFGLVLLSCGVIGGLLGYAEDRIAIRPLKQAGGHAALVTTVGCAILIQGIALLILGTQPKVIPFPFGQHTYQVFGGSLGLLDLSLLLIALILGIGLHLAAHRTRWGLAGRAATSDPDAAILRGVDIRAVQAVAFALSGVMLTVVGTFVGMKIGLSDDLGNDLVIIGFVGFALGGFGSYIGALVGGLLVGIIQLETQRYTGSEWSDIILYGVLLSVLLVRPTGIFGKAEARTV
jgi:branched-chain amino acid transport system permease protein